MCDNDMERFIISECAEMIDSWDAASRDDAECRELFANLQGMLRVYQSAASCEGGADPTIGKGLIDKLRRTLGHARSR